MFVPESERRLFPIHGRSDTDLPVPGRIDIVIVDRKRKRTIKRAIFPSEKQLKRLLLILLSLFAYVFSLEYLGFSISTFLFVNILNEVS